MASDDKKLPFHRKYRPSNLKGYVGNEKMKQSAMVALAKEVKPQVILLEGDSGCGKTTFARILAREYCCEHRDDNMGACGTCYSCQLLDEYITTGDTSMLSNVREIDITDQSGKKDIEGVLEEMEIPAYGDEWKVYIFDECHEATSQAQNRFLKICEEPPEHVLIIFCTTNPERMIHTLVNRCQLRLKVRKPTVADLAGLLKFVCQTEGVSYDTKGLNYVALRSGLTIRDALKNLEQIINEKGDAYYESAIKVFEEVSDTMIVEFYKKLLPNNSGNRDITGYVTLLHKIKTSTDLRTFIDSITTFTKRAIYVINNINLDGVSEGELKAFRDLFSSFSVEQMTYLLLKLDDLRNGDVETKLLTLGYVGLSLSNPFAKMDYDNMPVSKESEKVDSSIEKIVAELTNERKQANLSHNMSEEEKIKAFEERRDSEFDAVDLDSLRQFMDVQVVRES